MSNSLKIKFLGDRKIKISTEIFTIFILGFVIVIANIFVLLYANMYRTMQKNAKENAEIVVNQIGERLELICLDVNTELSRLVQDKNMQGIFMKAQKVDSDDNYYIREAIVNALAFNNDNAIQSMNLYSDTSCLYPRMGEDINELLSEKELQEVKENNGGATWIRKNIDGEDRILVAKRVLLSANRFQPAGYIIAFINDNILKFLSTDFKDYHDCALEVRSQNRNVLVSYAMDQITGTQGHYETDNYVFQKYLKAVRLDLYFYIPKAKIAKEIQWIKPVVLQSLLFGAVIFLAVTWIMTFKITQPFKDLIAVMNESKGKLELNPKEYNNYEAHEFNQYYNALVEKNQKLIEDIYRKDVMVLQTRIDSLQSQINPHFLYNTLDSMYMILMAEGHKESAEMIFALSSLFRYALKSEEILPIQAELQFIQKYLEIERYRFGERINWTITIDEEAKDSYIPKLLIQPLVENAVKHGVEPLERPGCIEINVLSYDQKLMICVSDNGTGMTEEMCKSINEALTHTDLKICPDKSIGLSNVYRRIQTIYDKGSYLKIESQGCNKGTRVGMVLNDYKKISRK